MDPELGPGPLIVIPSVLSLPFVWFCFLCYSLFLVFCDLCHWKTVHFSEDYLNGVADGSFQGVTYMGQD